MAQPQQRPQLDPAQAAKLFFNPGGPLDPPPPDQQNPPNPQQQNVQPPAATSAPQQTPQQDPQQAPQTPSFSQPSSGPMSRADFFQQNPHASDAFMPARPAGDFDNSNHPKLRGALASAFAGLAELGGQMNYHPGQGMQFVNRWADQNQAQRTYDANVGRYKAEAENQAYGNYQNEAEKSAQTAETQTRTNLMGQNIPLQEQAQKLHDSLLQRWQSAADESPEAFQQYAGTQLAAAPAPIRRMVAPLLGDITKLPQHPPMFKAGQGGAVEPMVYKNRTYGLTPTPGEPPEVTSSRDQFIRSQQTSEAGKVDPIIQEQLGAPPVGNPEAMKEYGKKAEAIKTRMSAAPKLIVQNAQNGPLGGNMQIPQGATGEAALANVDHATAAGVRMIGDGKADFSTFTSRMPAAAKMNLAALVHAYNPDFDQNTFTVRKGVESSFASGDYSKNVTALNTAIAHMKIFSDLADALHNGDAQLINKVGNSLAAQTGGAAPTNFAMARDAFSGEVGKAFAGANVAEGDRKQVAEAINSAESPEQLKGAAQTAAQLLNGKLESLKKTYESGLDNKPAFGGGGSQQEQLPPQAAASLKEGHETTFGNGQVWTLRNGKAERIK